jgi:hypothetical protein
VAKKPHVSPSTLAYMERKLASVEHRRSNPPSPVDIARILAEMQSPDEEVRAHAVEQLCPCRVPWDTLHQLRKAAQWLQRDPSPMVRANARHVEEDAREIEALESFRAWITEREPGPNEAPRRSKGRRRQRPRTYDEQPGEAFRY